MRRRELLAGLPAVGLSAVAGCTVGGEPPEPDDLTLSAPAFDEGRIPKRFTCDGEDVSPPLVVKGVPDGSESLAIVGEWLRSYGSATIWLLWNLPVEGRLELPADIPNGPRVEVVDGARQGTNDEGFVGYRSPCHETPGQNEYRFNVYALDEPLSIEGGADRDVFDEALEGAVRSSTTLTAVYERF
jgi:Raf kinase inhibitor-like YbhB/YbcL family protein